MSAVKVMSDIKEAEVVEKDVVVIGNGPSGITLSYFLSGRVPYYTGNSSDEFLHVRLSENIDEPLVLQDLEFLSEGIEGRSSNPVSVLFDALAHPDADLGNEQPSLLEWKLQNELALDHVVLGSGAPGGAWKMMTDSDLLTVSLGTWMELPNLSIKEWNYQIDQNVGGRISVTNVAQYYRDYVKLMSLSGNFREGTWVTSVRKISKTDEEIPLEESGNAVFQNEFLYQSKSYSDDIAMEFSSCNGAGSSSCSEVTSVSCGDEVQDFCPAENCLSATRIGHICRSRNEARRRANTTCCLDLMAKCCTDEEVKYDLSWNPIVFPIQNAACSWNGAQSYSWNPSWTPGKRMINRTFSIEEDKNDFWEVIGVQTLASGQSVNFKYRTKNVVLATGSYDRPNFLEKPGEDFDFVAHSLNQMEEKLAKNGCKMDPVMIVGAGLSAADAIVAALDKGHQVVHIFRRTPEDPRLIFNNLPRAMYPEYHQIHRMMAKKESHPGYKPYAQHHVVKVDEDKCVTLHGSQVSSHLEKIKVSLVVVLIGSSPDLDFLPEEGRELGIISDELISRNNLVDIDLFSHESVRQRGIYSMGPLVGDNFVRFLQGGALAITNHILKKKHREQNDK